MKHLLFLFLLLVTTAMFSQSENGVRVITGKCAIQQTGSGSGYWQVAVTNFNDPGGQIDATDIEVGWFIQFSDSGNPFQLEITEIVSASGSGGTFKVSNTGIVGISSVPTTNNASITVRTVNFGLTPRVSNLSDNDDQLFQEYTMYKIDSMLAIATGANWFTTSDTLTFSPSGNTPVNGDFAWWKNRGQLMEKKSGYWQVASSKNGENVHANNKVSVSYGGGGITNYDLNLGNYFYTSCNGDITINGSNEVSQYTNNSVVIEVFNNTEDYIDATFESGLFVQFGVSSADGSVIDMPVQRISAFGTRLFKFTVVNLGEIAFLVSDQVDNGTNSGSYTPTLTKAISTDTIVTTYEHHYIVSGDVVTVTGRALVNNLTSTISSSFLVSMPPNVTSNFDSFYNDVSGVVESHRESTLSTQYIGEVFADTTQDKVTVSYVCDGSNATRQVINYTYTFKIK